MTNMERRVQRLRRAVKPAGRESREAWRVLGEIARFMGHPFKAHGLAAIQAEARLVAEDYAPAFGRLPEAGLRLAR